LGFASGQTILVTGLVLIGLACSGGGGEDESSSESTARAVTTTTTSTTAQPEASAASPDDVVPYVEELLSRYDAAVNEIVADPAVVADRDSELVEEFLSLFEPGNEFADESLEGWAAQGDTGVVLKPLAAGTPVNVTKLIGPLVRVSGDEVRFEQCAIQSYVKYDDDEEVTRVERALLPGEGTAVRADGQWVLSELSTPPGTLGCLDER
jgi:hypothetical protein